MPLRLGRYFGKLFLVNAIVMAIVLAGGLWGILAQIDRLRDEELSRHLLAQASALEVAVRDRFSPSHVDELQLIANEVGDVDLDGIRITFAVTDGTVLADSQADAAKMESHADRPEIQEALSKGSGESVRWSHTVARFMKYIAVRVGSQEKPEGVVRVSMPVQSIAARAQPAQRIAIVIVLIAALAALLLALALAILWSRRIQRVTEVAQRLSSGDLSARVDVIGHDEVATLARSLNEMCGRLSVHLETIDRQRRTLDSLLSQLREGVVVADAMGKITLINAEAIEMLQPAGSKKGNDFLGRTVEQCVPHHKLQDLIRQTASEIGSRSDDDGSRGGELGLRRERETPKEIELRLSTPKGARTVLARAFQVRLPGNASSSDAASPVVQVARALLLTDITEMARVMQMKADLAANASHELRTPLSAIRAAIDTLHSVNPQDASGTAAQFIDVIDRHSGRMEAMIGDLLELSRLESGTGRFDTKEVSSSVLLEDLHSTFGESITSQNLKWHTAVSDEAGTLMTSPELLGIILRNLIDNAIRFTSSGGEIRISIEAQPGTRIIRVTDSGCGIPKEEQQRIFERFYQVEQARSGSDRGTGLGLSIVRHAAAAINAQVDLKSTVGKGTEIAVHLPHES